jgi:hypothetical protein
MPEGTRWSAACCAVRVGRSEIAPGFHGVRPEVGDRRGRVSLMGTASSDQYHGDEAVADVGHRRVIVRNILHGDHDDRGSPSLRARRGEDVVASYGVQFPIGSSAKRMRGSPPGPALWRPLACRRKTRLALWPVGLSHVPGLLAALAQGKLQAQYNSGSSTSAARHARRVELWKTKPISVPYGLRVRRLQVPSVLPVQK